MDLIMFLIKSLFSRTSSATSYASRLAVCTLEGGGSRAKTEESSTRAARTPKLLPRQEGFGSGERHGRA